MAATLHVRRSPGGYTDRLRTYRVLVDGSTRARIKAGESVDLEVEPGVHTTRIRVDWCGSKEFTVPVADGETVRFEATPRPALVAPFAAFFFFWNYVRFERI